MTPPSLDLAAQHYRAFLEALGLDKDPVATQKTAKRVTELISDWTESQHREDPPLSIFDAPQPPDWVALTGLQFYSLCEHHMVPFFGQVDVVFLPQKSIIGFNAVSRLIDHHSKKPQLQETLGSAIADSMFRVLQPQGLLIRIAARQMCMELRGHPSPTTCISLASRGTCRNDNNFSAAMRMIGAPPRL